MKKMMFYCFSFVFILSCFIVGCTNNPNENTNKIVIWHWMNDRQLAFDQLAKDYLAETGVAVEFKLFSPPDIYSQKVIAAARAGNLPDIFGIIGEKKTFASFIKANYLYSFTDVMKANDNEWENRFYPNTLKVVVFEKDNSYGVAEGIYAVPIDTTIIKFVYNKDIFKKAGLDPENPPADFAAFLAQAKAINKAFGFDGFVCGWSEGWLLNCLATEWAFNIMGEKKFFQTIEGVVPYTDPQWVKVFSLFKEMSEADILNSNITTMINKEAEEAFSQGKAGFSFNGSWAVNVYKQLNPDLNYGYFSPPSVSQSFPVRTWGGAGSSFMINAKSKVKEQAVNFLKWITEKKQQEFLVKETNNLPSIQGCEEGIPPLLKSLINDFNSLTHPDVWPDSEDSRVVEVRDRGLQQIIMGIKSPEDVAKEIQDVKKRVSKK